MTSVSSVRTKKRKLSLPKITNCLDAQADRPTTVKGRFLVKNDI